MSQTKLTYFLLLALVGPAFLLVKVEEPQASNSKPVGFRAGHSRQTDQQNAAKTRADFYGDSLPVGAIARMGSNRLRHAGAVRSLVFISSEKLASAGTDKTVRLWSVNTGKQLLQLDVDSNGGFALAVSPDGRLLSTGGNAVYLWDTTSGKIVHRLEHGAFTWDVAISLDGKRLVSADNDSAVRLWDVASGKLLRRIAMVEEQVRVAISPTGKILATSHLDAEKHGIIRLWDTATGKQIRDTISFPKETCDMAFSHDGRTLATGSWDTIHLWEVSTGKMRWSANGDVRLAYSVLFSADGKKLLTSGTNGEISMWDAATGNACSRLQLESDEKKHMISAFACSPDGATLVTTGGDSIRIWDAATGKEKPPTHGHASHITALAFTPDGKRLITGGESVIAWDSETGMELRSYPASNGQKVFALALSPDSQTLAAGCLSETFVWNTLSGEEVLRVPGLCTKVGFLPQGRILVASGDQNNSWDLATKKIHAATPEDVLAVAPNGHILHRPGRTLSLYDPDTKKDQMSFVIPLPTPPKVDPTWLNRVWASSATISPNGKTLAAVTSAGLFFKSDQEVTVGTTYAEFIHIWDVATGKMISTVPLPKGGPPLHGSIECLAISPDGRTAAGGGLFFHQQNIFHPAVFFWDVQTGREIHQMLIPQLEGDRVISCLAFSPDGKTLATGGTDTTALVWELPPAVTARAN